MKFFMNRWLSALSILLFSTIPLIAQNNITIIGIGKLGLCMALCLEEAGYEVIGIDLQQDYVESINNKTFRSFEPHVNEMLQKSTDFKASCSLDEGLAFSDIYYVMVDTPSTPAKEAYDHMKVNRILSEINKRRICNKHIVIGCTVFPGYTRTIGKALIKDCSNTTLSYSPEFIAQGNIIYGLQHPDIVLIGEDSSQAGDVLEELYHNLCSNQPHICRMSSDSAEITKLAINCFITTKIAFANMIGDIADKTPGANKYDILSAIGGDNRIGRLCLKPGYGFGGPCFPRDNRAFGSYALIAGIEPFIPQATDAANKAHACFMIEQFLNEDKETYIFENVTYKDDCTVPIIEESQKLVVAAALAKKGKKVVIVDIKSIIEKVEQSFGSLFEYRVK